MRDSIRRGLYWASSANIALVAVAILLLTIGVFKAAKADGLQNQGGVSHTPQSADVSVLQTADAAAMARGNGELSASSVADFMHAPGVSATPSLSSLDPYFHEKTRSPITASALPQTGQTPLSGNATPMSLPWNAVEPVRFSDKEKAHRINKPDDAEADREGKDSLGALSLPAPELVQTWVKINVKAFKGSERRRSLIHFELWIDPPSDIKKRMLWVEYDLRSDAVQPRKKQSRNADAGFRAGFGSVACVSKIVMVVHYDDGRSQVIEFDGCARMAAKGPNQQGS